PWSPFPGESRQGHDHIRRALLRRPTPMSLYVVITVITALVTAAVAIPDFIPAGFVLANSAKVHVPPSWLPMLGALKVAGAIGLLVGVVGLPAVGIAA